MSKPNYDLAQLAKIVANPLELAPHLYLPGTEDNFNLNAAQTDFLESDKKYTYFVAHRRCGKCISGNSIIIDPETLKPIRLKDAKDVKSNFTFDFNLNKIVEAKAEWFNSGKKECLRLDFFNGTRIDLTYDHLLFTKSKGWIKAEEINIGDLVLAPSEFPVFGVNHLEDEEIYKIVDESIFFSLIPDLVFSLDKKSLCKFFYYLFKDHGRLFKEESTVIFHLKNSQMLKDVHHLLLRLGIWSSLDHERCKIVIKDLVDISNLIYLIGLGLKPTDVKPLRRWVTVSEISNLGLLDTYDLGMHHEDHNFVANDIIVHNSFVSTYKAVHLAITEKNKKIYVIAPSEKQVKDFFQYIRGWIDANPVIAEFWDRHGQNNHSQGSYYRSFVTGTVIEGRIANQNNPDALRGITGDYFFLDEAQQFSEDNWFTMAPFLSGDEHKLAAGTIRSWVIGTTNNPGQFYDILLRKDDEDWLKTKGRDYNIVYWPIDRRVAVGDYPIELYEQVKLETQSEATWNQEWLLKLGGGEDSAFKYDEILNTFAENYTYSDHDFSDLPHFIGVDWDKTQAGVNIVVVEYNPLYQTLKVVYREEFDSTEYHYMKAAERIIDLTISCNPVMILPDGMAAGKVMTEILTKSAADRGLDISSRLVPVMLNKNVESVNESLGTIEKEKIKPFLVSFLKKKMQESKLIIASSDHKTKTQFDAYKIEEVTKTTIKYGSNHEHIIDCLMFISYGIWLLYEGPDADLNPVNLEIITNFQEMKVKNRPNASAYDTWVRDEGEASDWSVGTIDYNSRSGIFRDTGRTFF